MKFANWLEIRFLLKTKIIKSRFGGIFDLRGFLV